MGYAEEHRRCESHNQEQLDIHGRDEDGDFEESRRTCIWQPLGLLTTVKPPALRERHDFGLIFALCLVRIFDIFVNRANAVEELDEQCKRVVEPLVVGE